MANATKTTNAKLLAQRLFDKAVDRVGGGRAWVRLTLLPRSSRSQFRRSTRSTCGSTPRTTTDR